MTNGFILPHKEGRETIRVISSQVAQLKNELNLLEKIVKKMLDGKKLSNDEKDTIDLLTAISQDTGKGWVRWESFKRKLNKI